MVIAESRIGSDDDSIYLLSAAAMSTLFPSLSGHVGTFFTEVQFLSH